MIAAVARLGARRNEAHVLIPLGLLHGAVLMWLCVVFWGMQGMSWAFWAACRCKLGSFWVPLEAGAWLCG